MNIMKGKIMSKSIDDVIQEKMKNPEFKKDMAQFSSSVALLKAREDADLTQRELAEKAGVPQSTVARIECGYSTSTKTLSKLASAMNKTMRIVIS
ncbi:XRE family transcriptional regulator [Lactobacillus helveticus]|nr:helix-turn-helix transcriptional regulator [Lactobacillus helveticus]MBW8037328.1 XRE family transcriptional regulator [Lactobacillus helveticus]